MSTAVSPYSITPPGVRSGYRRGRERGGRVSRVRFPAYSTAVVPTSRDSSRVASRVAEKRSEMPDAPPPERGRKELRGMRAREPRATRSRVKARDVPTVLGLVWTIRWESRDAGRDRTNHEKARRRR